MHEVITFEHFHKMVNASIHNIWTFQEIVYCTNSKWHVKCEHFHKMFNVQNCCFYTVLEDFQYTNWFRVNNFQPLFNRWIPRFWRNSVGESRIHRSSPRSSDGQGHPRKVREVELSSSAGMVRRLPWTRQSGRTARCLRTLTGKRINSYATTLTAAVYIALCRNI